MNSDVANLLFQLKCGLDQIRNENYTLIQKQHLLEEKLSEINKRIDQAIFVRDQQNFIILARLRDIQSQLTSVVTVIPSSVSDTSSVSHQAVQDEHDPSDVINEVKEKLDVMEKTFVKTIETVETSVNVEHTNATHLLALEQRQDHLTTEVDQPSKQIEMSKLSDIDLLLIGKTGNGKSATGNSILRRRAFLSKASTSSVTSAVEYEFSDFNGRVIKVVDGPGVGDTRLNNVEAVKLHMEAMKYAIAANPRGYHALLLVIRFGGRFTVEDLDTIAFLKKVFGEDFVKSYCILVLTCGDNFEEIYQECGQSFEEWCQEQKGIFKDLLEECDNRAIQFNNRTRDETIRCDQLTKLLQMVDNLPCQGHRYTDENFARAKAARERAMVEAKIPTIREETIQETSLIIQKLQTIQSQQNISGKIRCLEELKIRADTLYKNVCSEDNGTGAMCEFIQIVSSIQHLVDEDIKLCVRIIKDGEGNVTQFVKDLIQDHITKCYGVENQYCHAKRNNDYFWLSQKWESLEKI